MPDMHAVADHAVDSTGLLPDLQSRLGWLYDLEVDEDVRDFLVTDRQVLAALTAGQGHRDSDEKLLVHQAADGIDVALYLEASVLGRLAATDPREQLSVRNLQDFCTVMEGLSHFSYLAWNAVRDRPVTLLELEVQGEVDKYMGARLLLARQPGAHLGAVLLDCLFGETRLDPQLDAGERVRYADAAHLAGRYCAGLAHRYPADRLVPAMLRELRDFYRMPQAAKVSRIRATGFT